MIITNKDKSVQVELLGASKVHNPDVPPIITLAITLPQIVVRHLIRHRVFSFSSASSRAVPSDFEIPTYIPDFKSNKAGMSPSDEPVHQLLASAYWSEAIDNAQDSKSCLKAINIHKQWTNSVTEPFELVKILVSGTEWENFAKLRCHKDAQDEMRDVGCAVKLVVEYASKNAIMLEANQLHLPYLEVHGDGYIIQEPWRSHTDLPKLCVIDATVLSVSLVAQTSYRKLDFSLSKAWRLFDKFLPSDPDEPIHGSIFEFIGIQMNDVEVDMRICDKSDHDKLGKLVYGVENYGYSSLFKNNLRLWNQLRDFI